MKVVLPSSFFSPPQLHLFRSLVFENQQLGGDLVGDCFSFIRLKKGFIFKTSKPF